MKTVLLNSALIVKGYFEPRGLMRDEGSFGDHTSYCTLCDPYPVFHVTAITHRKYAVYSATIICIPRI